MPRSPHPTFGQRLAYALKAARMLFPGWGGQIGAAWNTSPGYPWNTFQPNSRMDWQGLAGDLWRNEVVSICLGWIADNYCQPAFQVVQKKAQVEEPVEDHPLTKLLSRPNPFYGASALWQAVVTSEAVSGNAYLLKARPEAGWGQPLELWYLPHWQVFPQWPSSGRVFVDHYIYRVPGMADQRLEVADVVHFRRGMDLYNTRSGEAPLIPQLREVCSDNEATSYVAAILANSGVPNVAISAGGNDVIIPEEEAQRLQQQFSSKFGGDNRGRALVCTRPMKVEPFQWSPEALALDKLPLRAEARLCAALRVPPMVVGLNVGDDQRTYANMAEARQMAYEDCLMPMQSRHCETLDMALLPDLGNPETECCRYDYENVRALQEDEDSKSARVVAQFDVGLLTRGQALAKLGYESTPEDDVYKLSKGAEFVPKERAGATHLTQQAEEAQQQAQQPQLPPGGMDLSGLAPTNGNGNGNQYAGAAR